MISGLRVIWALFAIALATPIIAQDKGREILLEMRDSLLSHSSMSYSVHLRIKFPFSSDTATYTERVSLQRDTADALFGGRILVTGGEELIHLYDGSHIHECNTRTDSCVRYDAAKGENWTMTSGQQAVLWFRDMLQPARITKRCDPANVIEWLGDTTIAGSRYDRVRVRFPDNDPIKGHEALYVISKEDRAVRIREERYLTEGQVLWYRWKISDVKFDVPESEVPPISALMSTAVITDYRSPELPMLLAKGKPAPVLIGDLFGTGPEADTIHYEGKVSFIDFWAVGCVPCRHSMPVIDSLHSVYAGRSVQFIGVNAYDDATRLQEFLGKRGIHYPTLRVARGQEQAFNVTAIPAFYLVDGTGRVAASWVGYGPDMAAKWVDSIEALLSR